MISTTFFCLLTQLVSWSHLPYVVFSLTARPHYKTAQAELKMDWSSMQRFPGVWWSVLVGGWCGQSRTRLLVKLGPVTCIQHTPGEEGTRRNRLRRYLGRGKNLIPLTGICDAGLGTVWEGRNNLVWSSPFRLYFWSHLRFPQHKKKL